MLAGRLASAYGGGMWHWVAEAPIPVFNAAVSLLGPLQAEASLGAVTQTAMGNGLIKKWESSRIMHEWERTAGKLRSASKGRPDSMEELKAKFQLAGMPVEVFNDGD